MSPRAHLRADAPKLPRRHASWTSCALLVALGAAVVLGTSACRESPRLRAARAPTIEPTPPDVRGPRVRFEHAGDGEVVPLVRAFVTRAQAQGRVPLVYVGATWCEPCQYFHSAAERGELDAQLPALALLEFDRDRDGERLDAAGYGSRMIPLFVSPQADGRASERRIEGSIHGPGSPAQILPRLLAILPTH